MREHGLDVIVATSPVNVTYFSNYYCWSDPLFKEYMGSPGASTDSALICAVFPAEGKPALVCGPAFVLNARESWVQDLHLYGEFPLEWSSALAPANDFERRFVSVLRHRPHYPTAADALLAVLRDRGLADSRIGLDSENVSATNLNAICSGLPRASIKKCSNLIRLIRMVKTPEELRRLTRAAEINEQVGFESFSLARAGISSLELIHHFRSGIARLGADFDHYSYGMRGLSIFTEDEYRFGSEDVMYMDWGCVYGHYFSDTAATLALNKVPVLLLERYSALRACIKAGASLMRPGVKGSEVQAAMVEALKAHGVTASFPHGHGIGMELRDYPIIVADNGLRIQDDCVNLSSDLRLEVGMVNNLEACVFLPLVGSVVIEESFVIEANGARALISQDRRAPFVALSS
jgi:Xaa-Pro aminopeptidase